MHNVTPVTDAPAKKRRRKLMKTCLFCQKRKLKCDRARPKCQQCATRKLPECIYTNAFNFDVTVEELIGKSPIAPQTPSTSSTVSNTDSKNITVNDDDKDLLNFQFMDSHEGKYHMYGPTSWKAIVNYDKGAFEREYIDLWNVQKIKYNDWKERNCPVEKKPKYWIHFHDVSNILKIICNVLPTYEKTRDTLDRFFSSTLHDVYRIVDRKQTMDEFNKVFTVTGVEPSFEGLLTDVFTDIKIPADGNLYYIGIILLIITHTMPNFNPDKSLTGFLEQLAFSPRFSDHFVERPQFLLLMYLLREYQSNLPIWETNQNNNLIMSICQSCTILGLDKIEKWCVKSNYSDDVIYSLKRTFYWTMFFDVKVSFEEGRTLYLSDERFDYDELYNLERNELETDREIRRSAVMTKFLKIVRPMVNNLNSTNFRDKNLLNYYAKQLVDYFECGVIPINLYIGKGKLLPADVFDLPIVALGGTILPSLYHMRKKYFGENSIEVNNGIIKYCLLMINYSCNIVLWSDQMDSFIDPQYYTNKGTITHHLRYAICLTAPIMKRVLFQFHDYYFQNISAENLSLSYQLYDKEGFENQSIPLDNFDIETSHYYQIIPAMQQIESIEKSIMGHTAYELHKRLHYSATFVTLSGLQMISYILAVQTIKLIKCPGDNQTIQQNGSDLWNEYRSVSSRLWRVNVFDLVQKKLAARTEHEDASARYTFT